MTDPFVTFRRDLHRVAELSGRERETARLVRAKLEELRPDRIVDGIAGHGLAAVWRSARPGPASLIRCELDALPIADDGAMPHASRTPGVAHKCGHDGHMAMALAAAASLAERPPPTGSVTVLFQPSEETGEGGARVLADSSFQSIAPDTAISLHNLPGFPLGSVIVREGIFAFGSVGAEIHLEGEESHAAEPERGRSPASALATAIQVLQLLASPEYLPRENGAVTVTHARLGEPAFGTSPGSGVVFATLRSGSEEGLAELRGAIRTLVDEVSADHDVRARIEWREPFPVTFNAPEVVLRIETCARELGLEVVRPPEPFRWSEDFGHFTARFPGALFGLGAGEDHPSLHHPDYDFPDALIPVGARLLAGVARELAGERPAADASAGGGA
jgi:amidohydrolase